MASRTNAHSGVALSFDPDAFGRPRAVRNGATSYIASAQYHPNGLVAAASR
ncbi:MAG TPA: hypothetical protein VNH64_11905 [Parvularculaceae bacterium]|nr:hypothetical protein [Parvularculaceae bacterium]